MQKVSSAEIERLKAQANAARGADRIPEAIELYKRLAKVSPRNAEAWWYLGTLYYDSNQYGPGAQSFQKFVALDPRNSEGWAMLGLCEYLMKQFASSIEHLTKGRRLGLAGNPDLARVVRYHQAVLLNLGKQFEAAQDLLIGFAVEHRESSSVVDAMGMATLRISEPLDSIRGEQLEMVKQFGKAAFLAGERKMAESRQLYDQLITRYAGQPNVSYAYGVSLLLAREPQEAVTYFKKELERDPKHGPALVQVALQAISSGNFEPALPYASKAVETDPGNFTAHYSLGRIYLELNQGLRAVKTLETAAQIAPDSPRCAIRAGTRLHPSEKTCRCSPGQG